MRYWWVNQNQTFRQETAGGYLWSPKVKANGTANPFYDSMREVSPGDIVLSFADTFIKAIGIARSHAYEAPKPSEFGAAGAYWEKIGWRVDVTFHELRLPAKPADHMHVLAPLLPKKYAPLRPNGNGLQSVYLTRMDQDLAGALIDIIGAEAHVLLRHFLAMDQPAPQPAIGLVQWEEHEIARIHADTKIAETERESIVLARRGQGVFKQNVMRTEKRSGSDRLNSIPRFISGLRAG